MSFLEMEDNGALSNPLVALEGQKVQELEELMVGILVRGPRRHKTRERRRNGEIVKTVEALLEEAGGVMMAGEIHRVCQERIGTVPLATVDDLLYKHARTGRIVRVRHGLYASRASGLLPSPPLNQTVIDVLAMAGRPMKLAEIHAQCEAKLAGPVSYVAVKSCTSRLVLQGRLVKLGYGRYCHPPR